MTKVLRSLQGLVLIAIVALLVVDLGVLRPRRLPDAAGLGEKEALRFWDQPYFQFGDLQVTPAFLVKAILLLALLVLFSRISQRLLRSHVLSHFALDEGQRCAIERFAGYGIFAFGLIVALQVLGVNLSSLAVIGGALGIGVGFGLQSIVANFVAGIILLLERPIKVGDRVDVGGVNGDVVRIGARSTWVRTNDNVALIIPNSEFINSRVVNWTANDRQVRFSVSAGVAYGTDPDLVRRLLLEAAMGHPDVLSDPSPDVLFSGFGDSSLDFELRFWTIRRVQTPGVLRSDLLFRIWRIFKDNNVEIPFPQRDLHLRSVPEGFTALETS